MQRANRPEGEYSPFPLTFSSARFRVGSPPLYKLPLNTVTADADARILYIDEKLGKQTLISMTKVALSECRVEYKSIDLVVRQIPDSTISDITVLVVAPQIETARRKPWELAVKRAQFIFSQEMSKRGIVFHITVEIIAPELIDKVYVSGGPNDSRLLAQWGNIKSRVNQILEDLPETQGHMSSIALSRLGFSEDPTENPVTVYISMNYGADEQFWPQVARRLEFFLDGIVCNHKLALLIEHNEIEHFNFPLIGDETYTEEGEKTAFANRFVLDRPYKTKVNMGADIGAARYMDPLPGTTQLKNSEFGTLGCYVDVRTTYSLGSTTKMALTNWHVARSCIDQGYELYTPLGKTEVKAKQPAEPGTELRNLDDNGYSTNAVSGPIHAIESPSRLKHNATARYLRTHADNPAFLVQHRRIQDFFGRNDQVLGSLYLGSGFKRRVNNSQMD